MFILDCTSHDDCYDYEYCTASNVCMNDQNGGQCCYDDNAVDGVCPTKCGDVLTNGDCYDQGDRIPNTT